MPFIRLSLFLILIMVLAACNQQEQNNEASDKSNENQGNINENGDSSVSSGGIVAGELEATLQVERDHAIFKIKNQTEQVKELILTGKTSYEYVITNEDGETIFQKAQSKAQYEQKHPITLKQAEEVEFKLQIPKKLQQGTYSLTAILHTEPVLKAKTTFTIEKN
ncbi:BsuPI-related putative proteinase inhibitor [Virgibacillus necropolis]|uniref:Intracellular proteinase inhibitor BsuPI domain-containing protein n=1 Tax=Virgibacillus necropolis TaxID=163877 RepID=A0A221MHU2_9BACI|nr:BsuPI-related putative proteinase inhibitor [Virgibacillus necropolis]ASN07228.1 hypothetical protein CFK40_20580 [Virgibacillus necropolis]